MGHGHGDERAANVLEGNNIMAQDGDGDGTHTTEEENIAPVPPVANIDLSLRLSNLAATKDGTEHGADGGEELLANDMDANGDLANIFLQLSLQSHTSIAPRKRKLAQDGDKVVAYLIERSNMAQDGDEDFLQLSLRTQTTISPRKRKLAQDSNKIATHLIEVSSISEYGDKSGANLIEGIDMARDRGEYGSNLIEGNNNMVQDRGGSGAPVLEKENIDLKLRLAFDLNMPAPVANEKASEGNTDAKEKTSEDGTDADKEILRNEMDAKKDMSEAETDETGDLMVTNTDAPEDAMQQDMVTSEERVQPDTTYYMDSS